MTDEQLVLKAQGRCIDCGQRQVDTRRTFRCDPCEVKHGTISAPKSAKNLRHLIDGFNAGLPGYEHPLTGIPPQLDEAALFGRQDNWRNGWDGWRSADAIKIHRDGHHTSHTGAASIPIAEDPIARITRQAGLDRDEAALARDVAARPADRAPARAHRLGWPERTTRRRLDRLRDKLAHLRLTERDLGAA